MCFGLIRKKYLMSAVFLAVLHNTSAGCKAGYDSPSHKRGSLNAVPILSHVRRVSPQPSKRSPLVPKQKFKKQRPSKADIKRAREKHLKGLSRKVKEEFCEDLNNDGVPEFVFSYDDDTSTWGIYDLEKRGDEFVLVEIEVGGSVDSVSVDRIAKIGMKVVVVRSDCCMQQMVWIYGYNNGHLIEVFTGGVSAECDGAEMFIKHGFLKNASGKSVYGITELRGKDCENEDDKPKAIQIDIVAAITKKIENNSRKNSVSTAIDKKVSSQYDQAITARLRSGINRLQYCFKQTQRHNNVLGLSIPVGLVVTSQGLISKISIESKIAIPKSLLFCIRKNIKRWKFPKAQGRQSTEVSFSLGVALNGK